MSLSDAFTLLGILAGPLIAFLSAMYFRRVDDNRDVRKTCAYLAQHLDVFAYRCAEIINDNNLYKESKGAAGNSTVVIPKLDMWPAGVELRLIEPDLLSNVLALTLKRDLSDQKVRFWVDVGQEEAMPIETDEQCGVLGSEAWEIAKALRKSAGLPDPSYSKFHWDVDDTLEEKRNAALEQLKNWKEEV